MNTFSSDIALPSVQMGRLEHLGLDGGERIKRSR